MKNIIYAFCPLLSQTLFAQPCHKLKTYKTNKRTANTQFENELEIYID